MSKKVVVIGAGAAGLLAAGEAARLGCSVILLEKNDSPGKKLAITGKGRCNVTNDCSVQDTLKNVPVNSRFLFSCLSAFPPAKTMEFFEELGVPLKTERGQRVFPKSDKAGDIVNALKKWSSRGGAELVHRRAKEIETENGRVTAVLAGDRRFECDCVLIATGGLSYKVTGSDGWGLREAHRLGHTVTSLRASLVPLEAEQSYCSELSGLSLRNVGLTVLNSQGKKVYTDFGEMLFTHFGVSGPMILSASAHLRDFEKEHYRLSIDLKPALDEKELDKRILRDFEKYANRDFANALGDLLPRTMIPIVIRLTGVDPETKVNSITREQRRKLLKIIKAFPVDIRGTRPINEAIITSGGVNVKEINPGTMESKLVKGLFFAGEVIDVDAYTGGFNLQIAWSTAVAAAKGMAKYKIEE